MIHMAFNNMFLLHIIIPEKINDLMQLNCNFSTVILERSVGMSGQRE